MAREQLAVAGALGLGIAQTLHVIRRLGVGRLGDALADPVLEAGRVVRTDADVLIHVEDDGVGPRHIVGVAHQGLNEGQLRVAGGEHGVGHPPRLDGGSEAVAGLLGGGDGQCVCIGVHHDRGRADRADVPTDVAHGAQHARSSSDRLDRCAWSPSQTRTNSVPRPKRCGGICRPPRWSRRNWAPASRSKLETMQPTGSFKVRGGIAAVAATRRADPDRAVIGSSAGNHGLGLAYAASKLGARVTVIVPRLASAAKVSALQQFDVRLVLHGEGYSEAEAHALDLAAEDGSRYVSPYNDPDVIAGQSTIALELLEQVPELGTVVVPCGGGVARRRQPGLGRPRRPRHRGRVGGLTGHVRRGGGRWHRADHGGANAGRWPGRQPRSRRGDR